VCPHGLFALKVGRQGICSPSLVYWGASPECALPGRIWSAWRMARILQCWIGGNAGAGVSAKFNLRCPGFEAYLRQNVEMARGYEFDAAYMNPLLTGAS